MPVEKLIIFQKIYDLLLWLYPLINRIPKSHRLVLGRQVEELGITILLLAIQANKIRNDGRHAVQLQMSDKLDELRILVRLSKDLHFMSITQYQFASERINEIGKILFGWMQCK